MSDATPLAITVRDPLWDTIRLDATAVRIVDSAAFQRLRYIRQLGLAYLIYPGATHTRFDHALGVYHLAQRALSVMAEQGGLAGVDPIERRLVPLAGLLHDIGHYPYSHAIEELEEGRIPGHHEALVGRFLADPDVREALEEVAPDGPARIEALIRGRSESPLQGLVSGSLDLDKIEYLKRDARFCGVPYGEVDVDRLLYALVVLEDPETGRPEVGVLEKGVAALESLLFSSTRCSGTYWHHAVRAATAMYKRIVADALMPGCSTRKTWSAAPMRRFSSPWNGRPGKASCAGARSRRRRRASGGGWRCCAPGDCRSGRRRWWRRSWTGTRSAAG